MSNDHSIPDLLRIAAPDAILRWETGEKESVKKVQSAKPLDEKTVSRWKMEWNLRTNLRAGELAGCLEDLRSRLEQNKDDLSAIIHEETNKRGGFCGYPARATSILSKFAFALYPETAAPYDQHTRKGLSELSGISAVSLERDYPLYHREFDLFADRCYKELHRTGQLEALRHFWSPIMSEILFVRRATDKLLTYLGRDFFRHDGEGIIPPGPIGDRKVLKTQRNLPEGLITALILPSEVLV